MTCILCGRAIKPGEPCLNAITAAPQRLGPARLENQLFHLQCFLSTIVESVVTAIDQLDRDDEDDDEDDEDEDIDEEIGNVVGRIVSRTLKRRK